MSLNNVEKSTRRDTLELIRLVILAIFVFGLVGVGGELLLLEHFESKWQGVPLVLMAAAIVVLVWHALHRKAVSVRSFQVLMLLFLASGIAGLILHYRGNVEFELELNPSAAGMELFVNAVMGATPALAPGAMIQLGLLGLVYTFRHPALSAKRQGKEDQK